MHNEKQPKFLQSTAHLMRLSINFIYAKIDFLFIGFEFSEAVC